MLRRRRATLALVVWTFFVWTTRIGNIWRNADLDTAGKLGRTALAASFTALAVAVVVALWRRTGLAVTVGVLGAWTTAVWLVRGTAIVAADHEVGFKAVHTVLAVVSIALAGLAWREVRSPENQQDRGTQGRQDIRESHDWRVGGTAVSSAEKAARQG